MANEHDDKLERQAKALFDESVERLDGARLSELNRARHRALEELDRGGLGWWGLVLPAGGAAALTVALVAVLLLRTETIEVDMPVEPSSAELDFEMLSNEDSLEMLEELEFYS
jgi:hypothetical protein